MNHVIKIAIFTVLVTAFYNYVGQMVPQKEVYPPPEIKVSKEMTTEQMVKAGREIVEGKGTCLGCHTIGAGSGGRFPDLEGVGQRAAKRKEGYGDIDYFAETLYEPDAYIVDGFAPGMTPVNKPPIGLSDNEILTVIAYLQSLGGTASVTMQTKLKYQK